MRIACGEQGDGNAGAVLGAGVRGPVRRGRRGREQAGVGALVSLEEELAHG